MEKVLNTSFDEELGQRMPDLKSSYNELRELLLEIADKYDLDPEYTFENESGRETPEGFNYFGNSFSIRDTKLFHIMRMGSQSEVYNAISELRKILNDPQLIIESELVVEIFGTEKEIKIEKENRLEKQKALEEQRASEVQIKIEEQQGVEAERRREYPEEKKWEEEEWKEAAE